MFTFFRSKQHGDSKVIFVREVILKLVDEMKEKCHENPSMISELKYILKV